jgi:signal transduction histidine kinase
MLKSDVLEKLIRESSLLAPDFTSFKRQESTFVVLNLFILAVLLLIHTLFASHFGTPPPSLIAVLAVGFFFNVIELIWLQDVKFLSADGMVLLTWIAIVFNIAIAFVLASLSYRQDIQYFALLIGPILQGAFRFSFAAMLAVLLAGTALQFFWVWNYFRLHPPSQINEYLEAGTIALVYATSAILVWMLVTHLRSKQADLERTRAQLSMEEKLAAVGRFSNAIAHEIRNPVAMISSALTTARNKDLSAGERDEMFEIAGKEAARLEKLTSDFLTYARPRSLVTQSADVADSIGYIADISRPHATKRGITIQATTPDGLYAEIDSGQVQQALLNLVMNAIEASRAGTIVALRGTRDDGVITVEVQNNYGPIPRAAAERIFEPFFTTKPGGTGLGLAIARNIARGHGGELMLSRNEADVVQFSMTLPASGKRSEHP